MIRVVFAGLMALKKLPVMASNIVVAGILNKEKNTAQNPSNELMLKAKEITKDIKKNIANCFNDIFS